MRYFCYNICIGLKQEVTKCPFASVSALTMPADYLKEMERTMPTSVIDNEIDTISKTINNSEKMIIIS